MVYHLKSLKPDTAKLCISNNLDYFVRHYWRLWLAHLAKVIISQTQYYQNLIRDPAHLKLELDSIVFRLPFFWTFPCSFSFYGYSGLRTCLPSLSKDASRITVDDSLSLMDSIRNLLKFLYMAV